MFTLGQTGPNRDKAANVIRINSETWTKLQLLESALMSFIETWRLKLATVNALTAVARDHIALNKRNHSSCLSHNEALKAAERGELPG